MTQNQANFSKPSSPSATKKTSIQKPNNKWNEMYGIHTKKYMGKTRNSWSGAFEWRRRRTNSCRSIEWTRRRRRRRGWWEKPTKERSIWKIQSTRTEWRLEEGEMKGKDSWSLWRTRFPSCPRLADRGQVCGMAVKVNLDLPMALFAFLKFLYIMENKTTPTINTKLTSMNTLLGLVPVNHIMILFAI